MSTATRYSAAEGSEGAVMERCALSMRRPFLSTLVSCIVISANSFSPVSDRRLIIHQQLSLLDLRHGCVHAKNFFLPTYTSRVDGRCCGRAAHATSSSDDTHQQINKHLLEGNSMRYLLLVVVLIIHGLHNYYVSFHPSPVLFGLGVIALVVLTCYTFYPAYANVEGGLECTVSTILAGDTNNSHSNTQQYGDNTLSLVIPAYNEAQRLPIMLDVTLDYLNANRKELTDIFNAAVGRSEPSSSSSSSSSDSGLLHYEFIIVNDGSTDDTERIIKQYVIEKMMTKNDNTSINNTNCDTVKIVSMHKNVGKGGAVKVGTLQSAGQLCLMVDADGATDIADGLPKVLNSIKEIVANKIHGDDGKNSTRRTTMLPPAAVFGSRAHLEEESSAKRSKIRTILMHSFHFFVKILCSPRIKDTQCGFKLFTHSAVVLLFTNLHLRRW